MSRVVFVVALVLLFGCSARPTYVDPRTAPIMLQAGLYTQTTEPERYKCTSRTLLMCKRTGGVRGEPHMECTCL
jgi:hypothetical protein